MTDRPILFSAPMVRALLAGTKTQTRRIVKPRIGRGTYSPLYQPRLQADGFWADSHCRPFCCPYGTAGGRLWVRESLKHIGDGGSVFMADNEFTKADAWPWKNETLPSIHCPRGLSRITLDLTEVRVERLQDISEEDAIAEGVEKNANGDGSWCDDDGWLDYESLAKDSEGFPSETARDSYATLWRTINGSDSWDQNPWVWAISFKRVRA